MSDELAALQGLYYILLPIIAAVALSPLAIYYQVKKLVTVQQEQLLYIKKLVALNEGRHRPPSATT